MTDPGSVLGVGRIFKTSYGGNAVDFIDQLNYQYTAGVTIVFVVMVGLRQYVGKPIQCWVPQQFIKAWEDYAENLCWVQNTYFLRPFDPVPRNQHDVRRQHFISYYQWVGIALVAQALMAYVPHIIWRVGANRVHVLMNSAKEAGLPDKDLRKKAVACLVTALEETAATQSKFRRSNTGTNRTLQKMLFCGAARPNIRLSLLFLFTRILFIANCIWQIYLMQYFLGADDSRFGLNLLQEILRGNDWESSGFFPRVTFCTIRIRKFGDIKPTSYTLQCVLPINYFIEKIYVFLWFWYICLASLTAVNTVAWSFNICVSYRRVQFIQQYLRTTHQLSTTEERDCERFVNTVLGPDGIFILKIISRAASDLMTLDVTSKLWAHFRQAKISGAEDNLHKFISHANKDAASIV